MGKSVKMELFRAGKQTDSLGRTQTWTKDHLDKMVTSFKEVGEDVPACIGHQVKNKPAYGWFKDVYRKGSSLFGEMGDIVPEFGTMLKNKMFKKRSIGLRNDLSFRHVAFLGAQPPAVKGLENFAFAEQDEFAEYEFAMDDQTRNAFRIESAFEAVGRLFQGFRDKMIAKDGIDKTNDVLNQWDIDHLKDVDLKKSDPDFQDPVLPTPNPDNGGTTMDFEEKYNAEVAKNTKLTTDLAASTTALETAEAGAKDAEGKTFKELFEAEETKAKDLQAKIDDADTEAKDKEFTEYAEGLVKDEKILPGEKASVISMCKTLDGNEAQDFGEGDDTEKKTPLEIYKMGLDNNSVGSLFGEKFKDAGGSPETADGEIRKKTTELAKEKGISFGEASRELRQSEPGLFKDVEFSEAVDED